MDEKHRIEAEKNKPENRHKRLQEGLPFRYPLAVALELSNDCNSSCYMCPRRDMSREIGNMEFSVFKKIIDELAENKVVLRKIFFHWMGEPLLNKNFDKMIVYANERNVAEMLVMASNIIALDEDKAVRLIKSGLDELFVSLDALKPETYARIKGHDKHLKLIESNLIRLIELRNKMNSSLPYVRLKILKSETNESEIDEFITKWGPTVNEVYVEEDLNAWNGTNDRVNQEIGRDGYYKEIVEGNTKRWPCNRLWYQVAVSQDGYVTPCIADWDGKGILGNIKDSSLFELWNSKKVVEMRRHHIESRYSDLEMCKDCNRWIFRHMENWLIENSDKALATWPLD
jgi:radical SAM protein with 4Fe4S-binding SPASM domain